MDNNTALIQDLNNAYGLQIPEQLPGEGLEALLAEKFNGMIRDDFSGLVQFLYRMDVSEKKLRTLLDNNNGEDAGKIIARLVVERQIQKIITRRQYRSEDTASGEERW